MSEQEERRKIIIKAKLIEKITINMSLLLLSTPMILLLFIKLNSIILLMILTSSLAILISLHLYEKSLKLSLIRHSSPEGLIEKSIFGKKLKKRERKTVLYETKRFFEIENEKERSE